MAGVLILHSTGADLQTCTAVRQLARVDGVTVRSIGRGGDDAFVPTAAARLMRARESHDVVHAFGTAALATALLGTRRKVIFSSTKFPSVATTGWLRAAMQYRDVTIVCSSETERRALVTRGIAVAKCKLVRPAVPAGIPFRKSDAEVRRRLGIAEDDFVLLVPGESDNDANHRLALWAVAVLNVLDSRYRLLAWGRGRMANSLRNLGSRIGRSRLFIDATERLGQHVEYSTIVGAANAAVVAATRPVPTLPICMTMAAGLPHVAVAASATAELLEDRHTALLVKEPKARSLARRILDLREDAGLMWKIGDAARAEAYQHFSQSRFLEEWGRVYSSVAGR